MIRRQRSSKTGRSFLDDHSTHSPEEIFPGLIVLEYLSSLDLRENHMIHLPGESNQQEQGQVLQ